MRPLQIDLMLCKLHPKMHAKCMEVCSANFIKMKLQGNFIFTNQPRMGGDKLHERV